MVGWHHRLNGHEFERTPGDSEGQGGQCAAVHGVAKSQTQVSDQTTANRTNDNFLLLISVLLLPIVIKLGDRYTGPL